MLKEKFQTKGKKDKGQSKKVKNLKLSLEYLHQNIEENPVKIEKIKYRKWVWEDERERESIVYEMDKNAEGEPYRYKNALIQVVKDYMTLEKVLLMLKIIRWYANRN